MDISRKRHILFLAFLSSIVSTLDIGAQTIDDKGMTMRKMTERACLFSTDTASVLFCGDFMMHTAQIENALHDGRYDFSGCLSPVSHLIGNADIAIGNMEFALGGEPFTGYPAFSSPDTYPEYIADCGMDVFLLANNHILDKGTQGAIRTLKHYDSMKASHGIMYAGCGKDGQGYDSANPLYLRVSGIKVALVNFTYGTNTYTHEPYPRVCRMKKESLEKIFSKAMEDGAEIIIALPHWGDEYTLKASPEQKRWAQWLADQGADAIIGAHPHVVQEAGTIRTRDRYGNPKSVPVIYSLGNAISNMSAKNTRIGLFVSLGLTRDANGKATVLKPEYIFTWCTLPGRLFDRHTTIPVKQYLRKRSEWKNKYDHDLMVRTYNHVKHETGIQD